MKKTYLILCLALLATAPAMAQETYENAKIAQKDLNGTARYVGMGGALEALGADLTTMGTNPAGIGLYKHSAAGISAGLQIQSNAHDFANGNTTNASFDQGGFVWSTRSGRKSFLNFGFNYTKSRNLDFILSADNSLRGGSISKHSYIKNMLGNVNQGGFFIDKNTTGEYIGYENASSSYTSPNFTQLDYLLWNAFITDPTTGAAGYNEASRYNFDRAHTGYIGQYDFNISGNLNDRVFLGVTFGLYDVHYKGSSVYTESLINSTGQDAGKLTINDSRKITGTGFDIKLGAIFRPIEESPFRIGLYVHTPTWYDLTTENYTVLNNGSSVGAYDEGHSGESYDYKVFTPWRFGFSLGHTVGNYLALGATYEYADYSTIKSRINTDDYYDDWSGTWSSSSDNDRVMNNHTERTLKGVSTLKLGAEYKPIKDLAIRVGYNYVSSLYKKSGFKDNTLPSEGSYYASMDDYTNWKDLNRITCGLGYVLGKFTLDFAYQYSTQKGDFYPFAPLSATTTDDSGKAFSETNATSATSVKNNRHQLLFTLGYRF